MWMTLPKQAASLGCTLNICDTNAIDFVGAEIPYGVSVLKLELYMGRVFS